jgi:hypothetical protein
MQGEALERIILPGSPSVRCEGNAIDFRKIFFQDVVDSLLDALVQELALPAPECARAFDGHFWVSKLHKFFEAWMVNQ